MPLLSASNKRFVAGYALLVGLPLLALVGNLHLGRKLSAPEAMDGVWEVQRALPSSNECIEPLTGADNLSFTVSQSGGNLVVSTSADPVASTAGQIDGHTVTVASLQLWPRTNSRITKSKCSGSRISLSAMVDSNRPGAMAGELFVDGCPSCTPVKFTALKRTTNAQRRKK